MTPARTMLMAGVAAMLAACVGCGSGEARAIAPQADRALRSMSEALGGAEGEVNSYLGRRVAVPVETGGEPQLSAVLKSITLDLAEYRLHGRRPPVPEDVRYKYASAVQWLQRVASGEAVLPAAAELDGHPALGISGEVTGSPRVMSREELENL